MNEPLPEGRVVRQYTGEVYSHRILWQAALALAARGAADERGSFYLYLTASVTAFAALEAYANFLLDVFEPATLERERYMFRRTGVLGKLTHVERMVDRRMGDPDPLRSDVNALKTFRDSMMHAKPDRYTGEADVVDGENLPKFELRELDRWATAERWASTQTTVHRYAGELHARALELARRDPATAQEREGRLEPHALDGALRAEENALSIVRR